MFRPSQFFSSSLFLFQALCLSCFLGMIQLEWWSGSGIETTALRPGAAPRRPPWILPQATGAQVLALKALTELQLRQDSAPLPPLPVQRLVSSLAFALAPSRVIQLQVSAEISLLPNGLAVLLPIPLDSVRRQA